MTPPATPAENTAPPLSTPAMHAAGGALGDVVLPLRPKLSRLYRLQYEQVQSAWVLLYPEGMVQLNESAAEILRRCDGERSFEAIVAELETQFSTTDLAPQVRALLQESQRRGWIV